MSMKISLLINMKTIVGIFIFISRENVMLSLFVRRENFMLSWVEHEKGFITSGQTAFAVWSELIVDSQGGKDNKDFDQTARMRRLIRVFVERTCQEVRFPTLRLVWRFQIQIHGRIFRQNSCCLPSKMGFTLKGKAVLPLKSVYFPLKMQLLQKGLVCRKQTLSHKSLLLHSFHREWLLPMRCEVIHERIWGWSGVGVGVGEGVGINSFA